MILSKIPADRKALCKSKENNTYETYLLCNFANANLLSVNVENKRYECIFI